ncbi:minor capsid protein, partial [Clostridioides sp. ZZV15-6598]|uniref:minor capsid protein n=1 Tax=Clostridioides sp. ZZV15-6598 TaxID=2811501 RepID=UPI001D1152CA
VSKSQAKNLIMTESAFFASASRKDCFNDLDVEKYEIVATLDLKTSSICRELDGKVFDMNDYQVGITAPPFHPRCRTTTAPFFSDEEGYRAARGEDGKTYYVSSNMKYEKWYKTHVRNTY